MNKIVFDEGIKEFSINNDPNRIIRFNPSDVAIVTRFDEAKKNAEKALEEIKDIDLNVNGDAKLKKFTDLIVKVTEILNEQIDHIFGEGTATIAFGKQSPLTTVKGEYLFVRFIEGAYKAIKPFIDEEVVLREKNIKKYKKIYDSSITN